jgi:hypothetical protein
MPESSPHKERPADFEQRPLAWRYAWIIVNEPPGTESIISGDVSRAYLSLFEQLETARVDAVKGVLDLMYQAGTHPTVEREVGAIVPHSNGYSCWFFAHENDIGTHPLSAEEIVARIDANRAASSPAKRPGE